MAATASLREALNQGISSGNLVDTKVILYSHRDSSGRVCRPKVLHATSQVLKTIPYFNNLLFGNFAESQLKDFTKEAIDEVDESAEDYGYLSDSDLEDDEDEKVASVAIPGEDKKIPCEQHEERVEKGKVVKIPDVAYVTFQAFLMYLYTGAIEFAPFGSRGNRRSRSAEIVIPSEDKVPRPSPKSIYRLADKYDIPALKGLALNHARCKLADCHIVEEAFSRFASRYDEMRTLYVNKLASIWMNDSTETTRTSFNKRIDRFVKGELKHASEMLSALLEIVSGDEDITAPSGASPATAQVTSPAHWAAIKIALIKSIRTGVFFDRKYLTRNFKSGDVLKPVHFSSIIMGDKTQQLNNLVIYLKGRSSLINYPEGAANIDSDCEGDSRGVGNESPKMMEEQEEQTYAVLKTGSFSAWKSLFFYRCTDAISFAPLKSQGVDSRSKYICETKATTEPPPCSPKSIYVLATLLEIRSLCDSAFTDIKNKVSSDNVVAEVFSWVTASQEKIVDMQCDILISNFKNPKTIALMKENIGNMSDGSSPHCAGALKLGFEKAFKLKKRERGVKLRCANLNCGWNSTPTSYSSVRSNVFCSNCSHPLRTRHYLKCTGCEFVRTGSYESCQNCESRFI